MYSWKHVFYKSIIMKSLNNIESSSCIVNILWVMDLSLIEGYIQWLENKSTQPNFCQ